MRRGAQELHPSDQVRGYTEYCRRFHSAVQDHSASVHGCVLFTRDPWTDAYTAAPNARLAEEFPLFTTAREDVQRAFPDFFRDRLSEANEDFAHAFEAGHYRQQRGFVAQIGAQILDPTKSAFELLDGQRKAFAECVGTIRQSFHGSGRKKPPKRVVIVNGPPGAGKSVIAARLWATLVTDDDLPAGDVVLTTTSSSQSSNWSYLFEMASRDRGARGVVRKATGYTPLTTQELGRLRRKRGNTFLEDASNWRESLQLIRDLGIPFRSGTDDDANLVSIVDEAHALINPEHVEGRGQFGFVVALGPQAYHVIRTSQLSVFLLDPLQAFRKRENTTIDDIREWSVALGAGEPIVISLEGMQFRCAGSAEYVGWVESLLSGGSASTNSALALKWRPRDSAQPAGLSHKQSRPRKTLVSRAMDLRIFGDPEIWEAALRQLVEAGNNVRLLSTYSRPWSTRTATSPHALPGREMDFHEPYLSGGRAKRWSRIWNFVPNGADYTWFVAGHPGGRIALDPLCEVGCPYAVRGFDFDYVGILWLDDLVWRQGAWRVNPENVHETGFDSVTRGARKELKAGRSGQAATELIRRVGQAYRILLTRALKGAYLWVPDTETRTHLLDSVGPATEDKSNVWHGASS